ncbi:hypothetical protein BH11PSE2_BH11PSE2_08470 [soil metagenome]
MRVVAIIAAAILTLGLAAPPPASRPPAGAPACAMAAADSAWIAQALAAWEVVRRDSLKLAPAPRPTIVVFDAACRYLAAPGERLVWQAAPHTGQVTLPDGKIIPAMVTSFAAQADGGKPGFFVMALPSVWRTEKVTSELGLETMMEAVLIHEITHTRQFYFATPLIARLSKRYGFGDDLTDDSLQDHFKANSAYVKAYQGERDLLFAAATEPDLGKARVIAAQALTLIRDRRATWFVGPESRWAELDDLFMTMEGLGQWAGYSWLTARQGRNLDPAVALNAFRRGGRQWTQDEGLALFLVIDKLAPDWQARAFSPKPELGYALLERAVRSPKGELT